MTPVDMLNALLSKRPREEKKRNLTALNEICLHQYEINKDDPSSMSIANIGRICEARGLFKARTLYNKQADDYRLLIKAWAATISQKKQRHDVVEGSENLDKFLLRIEDFSIRSRVQILISENRRLQNQLNLCKKNIGFVIDQRPVSIGAAGVAGNYAVVEVATSLTASERNAIKAAISEDFLKENGFRQGSSGEIFAPTGRLLYDPGYISAIKKILRELN